MDKLKVFISGTQDDMKPEREAVDRAVNATTLATGIRAETAVSQPQSPRAWIEQQLQECNIYIGVYSHRYGWIIPNENVSATEFEFNLACGLKKPRLIWIRKQRGEEKAKPNFDRQEQFLSRVSDFSTGHLRQEFDSPADLEKWVTAALGETFIEIIRLGTVMAPINSRTNSTDLRPALEMARRALAILEKQAAGFDDLHRPPHLQIALEEKRSEVTRLQELVANGGVI